MSFMDTYSGSNQISMHMFDEENTSFITDRGLYCYKVMSFDLKNIGATYQRLVNRMFFDFIGKTIDVYAIYSFKDANHIKHLKAAFKVLRKYQMKLNLLKCAFGIALGKSWVTLSTSEA